MMDLSPSILFVLPSLRISGGVIETMRLAGELRSLGADARILSLWKHPNSLQKLEISSIHDVPIIYLSQLQPSKLRAPLDLVFFTFRYRKYLKTLISESGDRMPAAMLTHYSTLPFAWFTPPARRYCFLQGEEWLFAAPGFLRRPFTRFVLFSYAHCQVITANRYLTEKLQSVGLMPVAEAPIWADSSFYSPPLVCSRSVDLVMVLRRGHIKRLDLYLQLLNAAKKSNDLSCAVITSEDDIAAAVFEFADICLLRPSIAEMRALYQRSKVFVLLSEREGFGLPPLEAMGSGCVPLCRDSGGVRCYMTGGLALNLIPLDASIGVVLQRLRALLADDEKLRLLSEEAQRVFLDGAVDSKERRERALVLLSST